MTEKKPTYQELETKLAEAEQIIEALQSGQADVVISKDRVLVLRLREAEQALREGERRFKMAVQAIGAGVYEHRVPLDETLYHSPEWAGILGYRPEELPPFDQFEAWLYRQVHPDDGAVLQTAYLDFIEGKRPGYEAEIRLCHKQGHWVWVRGYSHALERDKNGRVSRLVGLMYDITKRKQAEIEREQLLAQLAYERQRLETILRQLPAGVMIAEAPSGRITYANQQAEEVFSPEYPREGVETYLERWRPYHTDGRPFHLEEIPMVRALQGKTTMGQEMRFQHKDGEGWIDVAVSGIPILDANGDVVEGLITVIEITERKRAEQALQALNERLEERVAERTATLETQSEQVRALSARLAEVQENERRTLARELHDRVGQNLSGLDFNLQVLKAKLEAGGPEHEPLLSSLDHSLELLEQTSSEVRNVLAELRPPILDDYGLVDTLVWYADNQARLWNLEISVDGETLEPRLSTATAIALFRIVQETLTNVGKHANASQVVIFVEPEPDVVRLIIDDNGRGFEPDKDKGATWGLRVMKERAEMVGGFCRIESVPGDGTRVVVEVPRDGG